MELGVQSVPSIPPLIIEPGRTESNYWRDLWRYRELFLVLAWRDISVRYKQTVFGVAWAVIRPFLSMVVFTIVFGVIAGLPSDGDAPYALMVYSAMLPWTLFASSLAESSNSLTTNANLISKVYFPRMIVPLATMITCLVDFMIGLAILFALMAFYRYQPAPQIVLLPFFLLLALAASLGPGLWLTSLNVKYRDFRYVIPFVVQFGMYISPVGFSSNIVPEQWIFLYQMNPLVGVIDGFRWCIIGSGAELNSFSVIQSLFVSSLFVWLGVSRFRKTERQFADFI